MNDTSNAFLSEQERLVRESARKLATDVVGRTAAERDRTCAWPHDEIKAVAEAGFMGMLAPQAFGGSGLSFLEYCLAIEEFAAADGGFATMLHVHSISTHVLRLFGTDAQLERYMPDLASARSIAAFLLSEPQAGSDTAAIATTARRDGDHYVINGSKQWISNGSEAGFALVVAATGEAGSRNRFSLFIVDPRDPGYRCLRIENKLGQHTAHTAQVLLENLRVPAANLIGEEGRGYAKTLSVLSNGRIAIAALAIGIARAATAAAIRYARDRVAYGRPLAELQAVRFDLAEMVMQIEIAEQYMIYAARRLDAGLSSDKEASIAKLYASEMAERVCSAAIQVHGGYGYVNDFPVERFYRDVRVTRIYEGTSHIQKLIIARHIFAD